MAKPVQYCKVKKNKKILKRLKKFFLKQKKNWVNVDHNKLQNILKEMEIPDHLTCLLRNLYAGQEQQLELDMEQQTSSKQEKGYIKAVYCHPACWEAWHVAVHGITKSQTWLSDWPELDDKIFKNVG